MAKIDNLKSLRAIGHTLRPVVTISDAGLTEGVLSETSRALRDHELIKIKLSVGDRALKKSTIDSLCEACEAQLVQSIGNTALLLKHNRKASAKLSNLTRVATQS